MQGGGESSPPSSGGAEFLEAPTVTQKTFGLKLTPEQIFDRPKAQEENLGQSLKGRQGGGGPERGLGGDPKPLCDIPSGCCSFKGPWTVTRSSLRMLRRVTAFCRPLQPVLLLVSFPHSRGPVVGVLGLCRLRMWNGVPFACQWHPIIGVLCLVPLAFCPPVRGRVLQLPHCSGVPPVVGACPLFVCRRLRASLSSSPTFAFPICLNSPSAFSLWCAFLSGTPPPPGAELLKRALFRTLKSSTFLRSVCRTVSVGGKRGHRDSQWSASAAKRRVLGGGAICGGGGGLATGGTRGLDPGPLAVG